MSDRDIRAAMQRLEDPLIIDPGFDPRRLQPASLELTLSGGYLFQEAGYDVRWVEPTLGLEDEAILLMPGDFVLASTVERVRIPNDMAAQVGGKSSWARKGLVIHQTAGFIDPGFKGQITLELSNVSPNPFYLVANMPICQLTFWPLSSPAERPYGHPGLGSHYQNQQGVTGARV